MGTSKQLITALEKADWLDRVLIMAALAFFVLVVLFIVKERVVDRSIRLAFWWTKLLPVGRTDKVAVPSVRSLTTSGQSGTGSILAATGTVLMTTASVLAHISSVPVPAQSSSDPADFLESETMTLAIPSPDLDHADIADNPSREEL